MDTESSARTLTGFEYVAQRYLAFGADGISRLKGELRRRQRTPLLDRFCAELYLVLSAELPPPTHEINQALAAADIDVSYNDTQVIAELNALWEELELEVPADAEARVRVTGANRKQHLWVDGDPVSALRTWVSPRYLVFFLAGTSVALGCWELTSRTAGVLHGLMWVLTLVGFAFGAIGGGALMLRRARYQNPDAYLPEPRKKDPRRP